MILADLLANTHCLPSLKDKVAVIRRPPLGPHDLQMNLGATDSADTPTQATGQSSVSTRLFLVRKSVSGPFLYFPLPAPT